MGKSSFDINGAWAEFINANKEIHEVLQDKYYELMCNYIKIENRRGMLELCREQERDKSGGCAGLGDTLGNNLPSICENCKWHTSETEEQ